MKKKRHRLLIGVKVRLFSVIYRQSFVKPMPVQRAIILPHELLSLISYMQLLLRYPVFWFLLVLLAFSHPYASLRAQPTSPVASIGQLQVWVGKSFDSLESGFQPISLRDTVFESGNYRWRVKELRDAGGSIFFEEDFERQGYVNRIRVETPSVEGPAGIRVGQALSVLTRWSKKWTITALSEYGMIDLYAAGLHVLVASTDTKTRLRWKKIPKSLPIEAFVLM